MSIRTVYSSTWLISWLVSFSIASDLKQWNERLIGEILESKEWPLDACNVLPKTPLHNVHFYNNSFGIPSEAHMLRSCLPIYAYSFSSWEAAFWDFIFQDIVDHEFLNKCVIRPGSTGILSGKQFYICFITILACVTLRSVLWLPWDFV